MSSYFFHSFFLFPLHCFLLLLSYYFCIVNQWRPFTMLVDVRLLYISVVGSHYNSGGQVILTINPFGVASLLDRLRITLSNRDRTRPYETINITIFVSCLSFSLLRRTLFQSGSSDIFHLIWMDIRLCFSLHLHLHYIYSQT